MRVITYNQKKVAFFFEGIFEEGTKPQTEESLPLQVIALKHPKGKVLVAHKHEPKNRTTNHLMECLVVFSGKVMATLYYENQQIENIEIGPGQGLMIVDGGVGYEILEDATMMEFKNGPFLEDKIIID